MVELGLLYHFAFEIITISSSPTIIQESADSSSSPSVKSSSTFPPIGSNEIMRFFAASAEHASRANLKCNARTCLFVGEVENVSEEVENRAYCNFRAL